MCGTAEICKAEEKRQSRKSVRCRRESGKRIPAKRRKTAKHETEMQTEKGEKDKYGIRPDQKRD